ncbi:YdeI/OmpD-associated family protein [Streptomyces sp. NRRL F-5630]|uniref:YdeI/OmpD-associated family protein n=1 Tax=Streptomyces sp. NRRL F-5630 TaxID=1463864 RepID=UPI003D70B2D9
MASMSEGTGKSPEPVLSFATREEWEEWLEQNHQDSSGIWFRIPKNASAAEGVGYAEALESALCYGWIDGQKKKQDERYWLQRFTPRRAGSKWSKVNREKATALIEAGRMRPAGQREVDKAKKDGRWEAAYAAQSKATVPDDLQAALDAAPEAARDFFAGLDSRNRYAILHRVEDAKKAETRAARIEKFVAMLTEGKKLY